MKATIACLIAFVLLLHNLDYCRATCGCTPSTTTTTEPPHCTIPPSPPTSTTTTPKPRKTTTTRATRPPPTTTERTTRPPTTRPPTTTTTLRPTPTTEGPWNPCQPCGPGGRTCPGCLGQGDLCQDLLKKIKELDKSIRQCVCAENLWLL